MKSIEVEIKSLLPSPQAAETALAKMKAIDPAWALVAQENQLNHYFSGSQIEPLIKFLTCLGKAQEAQQLSEAKIADFSLRTRSTDGACLIVLKAKLDQTSSSNGTARLEYNIPMPGQTLDEVDGQLLAIGFTYQAKWSRQRHEYKCLGANICIDKNAGYGTVVELEKMVNDPNEIAAAKTELRELMKKLGLTELPQERLERMFAYYNAHWQDYYGTQKTFVLD